jgi:hypothetical protein
MDVDFGSQMVAFHPSVRQQCPVSGLAASRLRLLKTILILA